VVTLTDAEQRRRGAQPRARAVCRPLGGAGGRARNPFECRTSAILTGVDGIERVFGNAVVERGPWLASVGIPTAVAMSRTLADLPAQLRHRRRADARHRRADVDLRPALA
jgi:hypothetical protein